jgi:hypothetical protein
MAAATLAATLGTASSLAVTATTWTVKPGGSFSGSAGLLEMIDTKTQSGFGCSPSSLAGTLKSGSGLAGSHLGSVTSMSATGCNTPAGNGLTFSHVPYVLSASSYSSGTTKGRIAGIHARGSGPGCVFVIDGTSATADNGYVKVTYSNSTGKLKPGPGNLHFYNVSGCFGLFHSGDPVTPVATYTLSPKQTITSP